MKYIIGYILILFMMLVMGCKSTQKTVETSSVVKDSITKVKEIKYVQEPLEYTSTFDISNPKPFKQSFTNRGVTTTIEKDSVSGNLKVTNKVDADTLLTTRDRYDYFNSISVSDKTDETINYVPNPINWKLPLILIGIIGVLIVQMKYGIFKIAKNFIINILK